MDYHFLFYKLTTNYKYKTTLQMSTYVNIKILSYVFVLIKYETNELSCLVNSRAKDSLIFLTNRSSVEYVLT